MTLELINVKGNNKQKALLEAGKETANKRRQIKNRSGCLENYEHLWKRGEKLRGEMN